MKQYSLPACVIALLFCLTSCMKANDLTPPPSVAPATETTSFSGLQAADQFSWETTKKLDLRIAGKAETEYQLVIKITLPDGAVLFQKLHKSTEDYTGVIEVPAHLEKLTISYGSQQTTFDVQKEPITFTIAE